MNSKRDMIDNIVNGGTDSLEVPPSSNTPSVPLVPDNNNSDTVVTETTSKWTKVKNAVIHPVGIFCITFVVVFVSLLIAKPAFVTVEDEEDGNKEKANMGLIAIISVFGAGIVVGGVIYIKKKFFQG